MSAYTWEQRDLAVVPDDYRPISPALFETIQAKFTDDMGFWVRMAILSQRAHDDVSCDYEIPKGFRMPTSDDVSAQQATFNEPSQPRLRRSKPTLIAPEMTDQYTGEHAAAALDIEQTS